MLNPSNWSATVWRIFGGVVGLLDFAFILTVVILAAQGSVNIHRAILLRVAIPLALFNLLFVWLVVGSEEGYWKGFLVALAFLIAVVAGSTLISRHMQ
jgi:uncharacterized membrane protein YozB (DUF420 family)